MLVAEDAQVLPLSLSIHDHLDVLRIYVAVLLRHTGHTL